MAPEDPFRFGDEDDAPRVQKDALDGFLSSNANPLAQRRAPPSIFSGASKRPVTPSEVWPDNFGFGEVSSASNQGKAAAPSSRRVASQPLQPMNSRRQHTPVQASAALHFTGGSTMSAGMAGIAGNAMLPAAGRGRRRPPSGSLGGFSSLTLG